MASDSDSADNSRNQDSRDSSTHVFKDYRNPYFLSNSDQPTSQLVANLFDGTNFTIWSRGVRMALGAKNKLSFIDGTLAMPNRETSPEEFEDWSRNDDMIRCWIVNSMNGKQAANFVGLLTAKQLWDELKQRHGPSNLRLYQIKREVINAKQLGMSVVDYYSILKSCWDELSKLEGFAQCECGVMKNCSCNLLQQALEKEEKNRLIQFLHGLDDQYEHTRNQILSMDKLPSVDHAYHLVLQIDKQKQGNLLSTMPNQNEVAALNAAHKQQGFHGTKKDFKRAGIERICDHCNQRGHLGEQCFIKLGYIPEWYKGDRTKLQAIIQNSKHPGSTSQSATHVSGNHMGDTPLDIAEPVTNVKSNIHITPETVNLICGEVLKAIKSQPELYGEPNSVNFAGKSRFLQLFSVLLHQGALRNSEECASCTSQALCLNTRRRLRLEATKCDKMKNKTSCLMGRYELGRLIGQGSFARVYRARSIKTSQSVAIKVIDKEKVVTSGLTNQVKREISVMSKVRHPNVVHLYEVMATKTKIYFVMEYAKGGELFDKVAQGKLDEEIAQKYFRQLISVVDFCHSRGVYHRDLKPENILLDAHENLKVSDFGLSAVVECRRRDGLLHTFCGTPAYVAPEVINQKGYEGDKADIWSCGVVLFVLLAGYLPFHHRNIVELYKKIGKAEYKFPKWFSHDVRLLLARILDPNPESRISIAKIRDNSWFTKEFNSTGKSSSSGSSSGGGVVVYANGDPGPSGSKEELIKPVGLSAFDIISRSRIVDLKGLFGRGDCWKEAGFTSRQPVPVITSRLMETAKRLRLQVKRIGEGRLSFESPNAGKKGLVSIDLEVFKVAPTIHLVEMTKSSGDSMEYQKIMSQDIRPALEDIVWAWHKEKQQKE